MTAKNTEIYAALKLGSHNIFGRVKTLDDGKLIFHAASEEVVPLLSFQQIDVFTHRHIYFRNLPVVVVSDEKIEKERFFSKRITRKIKVRYHNSEIASFLTRLIAV